MNLGRVNRGKSRGVGVQAAHTARATWSAPPMRSRGASTTEGETTPAQQGRDGATFPDRPTTTLSDGWHAKALPIAGRQASSRLALPG